MKPIRLELQAFGPYKDYTVVDFSQFSETGLFLLTGETGSGKTMIFDALTFALYGYTSGNTRGPNSVRSQLALPHIDTYVKLTFSHRYESYTILRNPTHEYAKKEGGRETKTDHYSELIMPDGTIIAGVMAVNEAVIDLLGLDYGQFKQIALIGQGEFRELLTSKSADRSAIFRKIFNTRKYQDFENTLRELNSKAKSEYDKEKLLIETQLQDIGLEQTSVDTLDVSLAELKIIIEKDSKDREKLGSDKNIKMKRLRELEIALASDQQLIEDFKELKTNKERLAALDKQALEIEETKKNAALYTLAITHILPIAKQLDEVRKRHDGAVKEADTKSQDLTKLSDDLTTLSLQKNKSDAKKTSIETLRQENHLLTKSLDDYLKLQKLMSEDEGIKKNLEDALSKLSKQQISIDKTNKNIVELEAKLKLKVTTEQALVTLENEYKNLDDILKLKLSLDTLITQELNKRKELLDLSAKVKISSDTFGKQQHEFYQSQAGLLASNLIENEPCPVCGSLHHPHKASLSETTVSKEVLDDLSATLSKENEALNEMGNAHASLKGRLDEAQSQYEIKAKPYASVDLETLFKKTKSQLDMLKDSLSTLKNIEQTLDLAHTSLSAALAEVEILRAKTGTLEIERASLNTSIKTLQEQLKYESYQVAKEALDNNVLIVATYEKEIEQILATLKEKGELKSNLEGSLKVIKTRLSLDSKEIKTLSTAFDTALETHGFKDETTYKEILLLSKDKLEARIREYDLEKHEIKTLIKSLEKKLVDKELPQTDKKISAIEVKGNEIKTIDQELEVLLIRINRYHKSIEALVKRRVMFDKKHKDYQRINVLFQTATGGLASKDRVTFENYVQSAYFSKVIAEANKRLALMTQTRYELVLRKGSSDKRISSGLDLDVIDHYSNKVREVSTLSGGESFKAALSLALGMSDVIQIFAGGIEVDMLFVDEGFGSLDQQSLDQAMQVLNSLSQGDRMIGIISHVTELKERIEQQIIVKKDVGGSTVDLII